MGKYRALTSWQKAFSSRHQQSMQGGDKDILILEDKTSGGSGEPALHHQGAPAALERSQWGQGYTIILAQDVLTLPFHPKCIVP